MPYDASGSFSRFVAPGFIGAEAWERVRDAGRAIRADDMDRAFNDLAAALNLVLLRDGRVAPTANLPMGGRKHTGVADAVTNTEYQSYGQARKQALFVPNDQVATSDDGNTITLTPQPPLDAYAVGMRVSFIVQTTNTGAVTLNISGNGAHSLVYPTRATSAGDLIQGRIVDVAYTGSGFVFIPTSFHLHSDAPTAIATLSTTDRLLVSDESAVGDPNRYLTVQNFLNYLRSQGINAFDLHDHVTEQIASLHNDDRLIVSDESAAGDPNRYATLSQLITFLGTAVADQVQIANAPGHEIFTADGTWIRPGGVDVVWLTMAGGGGGGSASFGGGGAGVIINQPVRVTRDIAVTVGSGGAVNTNGENSAFGLYTVDGGHRGTTAPGTISGGWGVSGSAGSGGVGGISGSTDTRDSTLGPGGQPGSSPAFGYGGGGGSGAAGANGVVMVRYNS